MSTGVQFTGNLAPGASGQWFTHSWPQEWNVVWYMVPTSPQSGAPQIDWTVGVERADATNCTYWITVNNLTQNPVTFEARYAVLG